MSNLDVSSYSRLGQTFFVANQAAKATTTLSTTCTGLYLHNPWGSGKKLILVTAQWIYSTIPTGAGGVMLCMSTAVSTAAATGTAEAIYNGDGSGASTTSVAKAFTIITAPSAPVFMMPLVSTATAASSNVTAVIPDGSVVVVPGAALSFGHITTVATGIGSYFWIEVPA